MIVDTCLYCIHYQFNRTCTAFKDKIPDEIWKGGNDHRKPLAGQGNSVVFEEIKDTKKVPPSR